MTAKSITEDYVADLCRRIGDGATPEKETTLSSKEFTRRMLPHVKDFLARGYSYKEIAAFFGHVSAAGLKKAVLKEMSELKADGKTPAQTSVQPSAQAPAAPAKASRKPSAKPSAKPSGKNASKPAPTKKSRSAA